MAEPAAADDPAARKPGPSAPGWADVRRALVTEAQVCALATVALARSPASPAALEMAKLTLGVLESLGDLARRLAFDEAVLEQERAAAFAAGVAACKAARCRLEVIDGAG